MLKSKTMISYAQNFEDVILDRLFCDQSSGFYVDVGAYHPCENSVTRHFYENGWRGINIEPASMFEKLVQYRPRDINLRVAVSDKTGSMTFVEFPDEPTMSGLATTLRTDETRETTRRTQTCEIPVRPLREIFAEHSVPPIDFMSVDVEGHEKEVLAGNDWSKYRPRILVIEATMPNTSIVCSDPWEGHLEEVGYRPVYFDGLNKFYLREEDQQFESLFKLPPNVFDNFRPCQMIYLEQILASSQSEMTRMDNLRAKYQSRAEAAEYEMQKLVAGTGPRSLRIGLAIARWISGVGAIRRKLPWRRPA